MSSPERELWRDEALMAQQVSKGLSKVQDPSYSMSTCFEVIPQSNPCADKPPLVLKVLSLQHSQLSLQARPTQITQLAQLAEGLAQDWQSLLLQQGLGELKVLLQQSQRWSSPLLHQLTELSMRPLLTRWQIPQPRPYRLTSGLSDSIWPLCDYFSSARRPLGSLLAFVSPTYPVFFVF